MRQRARYIDVHPDAAFVLSLLTASGNAAPTPAHALRMGMSNTLNRGRTPLRIACMVNHVSFTVGPNAIYEDGQRQCLSEDK